MILSFIPYCYVAKEGGAASIAATLRSITNFYGRRLQRVYEWQFGRYKAKIYKWHLG